MKISVIVTSYNQESYLIQTLDSIMAQTLKPFEVIVCDDGSSDGSRHLISSYRNRYPDVFRPIFQEKNLGVTRNRNTGIKVAKGDYITTLDGDDLYLPEKLEKELHAAVSGNAPLVYSNVRYIDETGNQTGIRYRDNRQKDGYLFEEIATLTYPAPREVLIAKHCIETLGIQDDAFALNEDFEWIVRLSSRFPFAAVREPLVCHRYHAGGLSRSDRRILLETLVQVTDKMISMVTHHGGDDEKNTLRKLEAFKYLTQARIGEHRGDTKSAWQHLACSIKKDWLRSANYDLFMRLCLPGIFKRQSRIPDAIKVGPLALPFYFARGVI